MKKFGVLLFVYAVVACGGHNGATGDGGGGNLGSNGLPLDGFPGCHQLTEACAADGDCCSNRCDNGQCLPGGVCTAGNESCTDGPTNTCCSGRCEPVEGMSGVTQCLPDCVADGVACTKATDCCNLDCNGGKCGGTECGVESEPCTANGQCCSNLCMGGQCQLDSANTTCRGIGETCNSGPQMGCCSQVCDKQTSRCVFGSDACRDQNGACTADADCCQGVCTNGVCTIPCTATSGACTTGADCCSSVCINGSCQGLGSACSAVGSACTMNAQCCSDLCIGGFCGQLIQ
jgi:hypothetical protein